MFSTRLPRLFPMSAVLLVAAAGCLKRKEVITIARDGRVSMRLEYEADSREELFDGDAVPSGNDGWAVDHTWEVDKDGEETHTLTAERSFPPGAKLPGSYARRGDADRELYLRFPTTLRLERRDDGVYYHFRREYPARPAWSRLNALCEKVLESELEDLSDKDPKDMTHEERVRGVKALVDVALIKMKTFARAAFLEITPEAPQDHWLKVFEALNPVGDELDYDHLADMIENCRGEDSDDSDTDCSEEFYAAIEAEALNVEATAMARIQDVLVSSAGYNPKQLDEFMRRYKLHKRYHDISEDLGDEEFEIIVVMPGEIVAGNGDETDDGAVEWEFDGRQVRDSGIELMVTSRVAD